VQNKSASESQQQQPSETQRNASPASEKSAPESLLKRKRSEAAYEDLR